MAAISAACESDPRQFSGKSGASSGIGNACEENQGRRPSKRRPSAASCLRSSSLLLADSLERLPVDLLIDNRPVAASRLVKLPLTGFWTCERFRTAPLRCPSPGGGLVAMVIISSGPCHSFGRCADSRCPLPRTSAPTSPLLRFLMPPTYPPCMQAAGQKREGA